MEKENSLEKSTIKKVNKEITPKVAKIKKQKKVKSIKPKTVYFY